MNTNELLVAVMKAAVSEGVTLASGQWLLVWDKSGICRAYATTHLNFHFAVQRLDQHNTHYSIPLIVP